jgi:hypothetical protein
MEGDTSEPQSVRPVEARRRKPLQRITPPVPALPVPQPLPAPAALPALPALVDGGAIAVAPAPTAVQRSDAPPDPVGALGVVVGDVLPPECASGTALPLPVGAIECLPATAPLDLPRVQALAALLHSISTGGEPFGSLVMPVRRRLEPEGAKGEKDKKKGRGKGREKVEPPKDETTLSHAERQWPTGPLIGQDLMTADEVQRLVERILQDQEIMAHPTMPGLTRARLREAGRAAGFEPNRFGRLSAALLVWFAAAGVTVIEDDTAANEWIRPRRLVSPDRVEIRRRLRAVDPPDGDAIEIARKAGLGSSVL